MHSLFVQTDIDMTTDMPFACFNEEKEEDRSYWCLNKAYDGTEADTVELFVWRLCASVGVDNRSRASKAYMRTTQDSVRKETRSENDPGPPIPALFNELPLSP